MECICRRCSIGLFVQIRMGRDVAFFRLSSFLWNHSIQRKLKQRRSKQFDMIWFDSIRFYLLYFSITYNLLTIITFDSTNNPKDRIFVRKTRKNQSRSLRFASQNSSQTARRSQHARIRRNRVVSAVRRPFQKRHF